MELFDHFLIEVFKDLQPSDLLKIHGLFKKVTLKKGEVFLEAGTYSPYIFYVRKGLMRGYVLCDDGQEKTIFFRWQKEFGSDPKCFFDKEPACYTWEALEPTTLLLVNNDSITEISKKNIGMLKIRNQLQTKLLKRMFERVEEFIIYNHEQRFKKMLDTYPDLCERIQDKHLASFLGITPVSLSRIKKRLL